MGCLQAQHWCLGGGKGTTALSHRSQNLTRNEKTVHAQGSLETHRDAGTVLRLLDF